MKSRVAERGQVTIPKALRNRLGVVPGTTLEFSEEHGRLVAVKTTPADPVAKASAANLIPTPSWRRFGPVAIDYGGRYQRVA